MSIRSVLMTAALAVASVVSLPVKADDASAARAELTALWQKMFESRDLAFSAVVVTTDKKGREHRSDMRVNWPDKFHMKSPESEFIIIGDSTWMKPEGQGWMKFPMSMKKVIDAYTPNTMKSSMDTMMNVRLVGAETVNGIACKVYAYDFDTKVMGVRSKGTSTMWLNGSTGYPVRVVTEGEAMGQQSKTVVDYTYDSNIRIAAPN